MRLRPNIENHITVGGVMVEIKIPGLDIRGEVMPLGTNAEERGETPYEPNPLTNWNTHPNQLSKLRVSSGKMPSPLAARGGIIEGSPHHGGIVGSVSITLKIGCKVHRTTR